MNKLLQRINATFQVVEDGSGDVSDFPSRDNRMWNEQGELWNQGASKVAAPTAPARSPAKAFDFSATEIVRTRVKRSVAVRTQSGTEAYAERRRSLNAENIARFMQVNHTVQGGSGFAYRVIQAVRGVSADYDLWKGPTKQVTFFLG